jgi:hypothetical protein
MGIDYGVHNLLCSGVKSFGCLRLKKTGTASEPGLKIRH